MNAKATPTFNADDAVVLVYDTSDDNNLTLVGVKATAAATAIDFSTSLAAATAYYVGVLLEGTSAKGVLLNGDGKLIEDTVWMADAVTADTLLTPWAFTQNRAGAVNRTLALDRLLCYQLESTGA